MRMRKHHPISEHWATADTGHPGTTAFHIGVAQAQQVRNLTPTTLVNRASTALNRTFKLSLKTATTTSIRAAGMSNQAAFIDAAKAHPFSVREAAYPTPKATEIVVRSRAVAANPVDWKLQDFAFFPIPYPNIFGQDVAGEVVEVGADVKGFPKGQRVLAHALGLVTQDPRNGAFQQFVAVSEQLTAIIPDGLSYEAACVLPLCLSTAAAGLYQQTHLALEHPSTSPKPTGKTVLIWGGSSAVGSCAIQLAKASGYEVIATASKENAAYVQDLGAEPFDHASASVADDIVAVLKGKEVAGAYDCICQGETTTTCVKILEKAAGSGKIATVEPGSEKNSTEKVQVVSVMAPSIASNEVAKVVYHEFLPKALAEGTLKAKPDPLIVGKGLEEVQAAVDRCKAGVSAQKVVVSIP